MYSITLHRLLWEHLVKRRAGRGTHLFKGSSTTLWMVVEITPIILRLHECASLGMSSDEDINTLATIIPSIDILGPITRSRAQQLNHQINSFLCSSAYNIESQLLPNNLIIPRNQGKDHGGQTEHQEGAGEPMRYAREGGDPIQFGITEFESNSEFRTTSYSN
jgi:hypothetical protein